MGMASGTAAIIGAVTAVATAAMGTYTAVQQAHTQKQQAEYQKDMAKYNAAVAEQEAQMAEAEGDEFKRDAYEASVQKRQEAALIVGKERAKQAGSGVVVDTGSTLDLNLDTTEKGQLDALHLAEQGQWQDYNKRVDAWHSRNQGEASKSKAASYSLQGQQYSPLLSGSKSLLSGMEQVGTAFGKLM